MQRTGFHVASVHSIVERSLIASSLRSEVDSQGHTAIVGQVAPKSTALLVCESDNQPLLMPHTPGRGRPTTDGTDRMRHPANPVLENETMLEQSGGNNAAALENEFSFRTHEDHTDLDHPFLCREVKPDATHLTEDLHELCVR